MEEIKHGTLILVKDSSKTRMPFKKDRESKAQSFSQSREEELCRKNNNYSNNNGNNKLLIYGRCVLITARTL